MSTYNLIVTENCNLRCSYCYMKHPNIKLNIEDIPEIYKTIKLLDKIYNKFDNKKQITYFGGEPLINWEFIKAFYEYSSKKEKMNHVIISNGLLLDEEKIKYIKENNIGISISFDGLWNDENRPLLSGKSSFDEYIKKRDLIKEVASGCKIMVSPNNISTMSENFKFFVDEYGINNPDFSIVRDDIWKDEDVSLFETELIRLKETYKEYILNDINCSIGFFNLYILDLVFNSLYGKREFGCFAGHNGVAIYPDKKVYPCGRFASAKKYPLYDMNEKKLYHDNIKLFQNPKITNPQFYCDKECEIYKYCNGGCLYSQFINNGNEESTKPIKNVCKILKLIYREVINITEELKDNETFKKMIKNLLTQNFG